jgi:uncharacterized protein YdeI (YjbR/CyaY-like superfamily)
MANLETVFSKLNDTHQKVYAKAAVEAKKEETGIRRIKKNG